MPRVISGTAGGLQLKAPKGDHTRPTGDRAKEALFSMLDARIDWTGLRVLDLFAGSGQLGIEALSRGAAEVVFVERDRAVCRLIQDNLAHCRLTAGATVVSASARGYLERLADQAEPPRFDVVLMDPPYRLVARETAVLLPLLAGDRPLLNPGSYVVCEHGDPDQRFEFVTDLKPVKRCQYGASVLSFLKYDPLEERVS